LEDLENTVVIWTGQVNVKNGTATDEVTDEQVKILGRQMSVTNSVYKNCMYLAPHSEIIVKMNSVDDGTVTEVVKYRYIRHKFALAFTLKILTKVFRTLYGTSVHS
jgi:hypothetical protein